MKVVTRLKQLIENSDYSYEQLGAITGIAKSSLQRYTSGNTKKIPVSTIEKLAPALSVSTAYLMGWGDKPSTDYTAYSNIRPITTNKIPILGEIACGVPIIANVDYESYVNADVSADFALVAKGDSMINARIYDGDLVFIREQTNVENGEIAAIIIDGKITITFNYSGDGRTITLKEVENSKGKEFAYYALSSTK